MKEHMYKYGLVHLIVTLPIAVQVARVVYATMTVGW